MFFEIVVTLFLFVLCAVLCAVLWFLLMRAPGNPFDEAYAVVQTATKGDLIEFPRKKFYLFEKYIIYIYSHWEVYIGKQQGEQ